MISRYVHNHTPCSQLNRPEFSNYLVNKNKIPKDVIMMNIDDYEL